MTHEERDLAQLATSISQRIRRVCVDTPPLEFAALCLRMARLQRRGEQRSILNWTERLLPAK